MQTVDNDQLRPIERIIVRLSDEGVPVPEIGRRIGKRPGTVERIITMIDYKRDIGTTRTPDTDTLNPLEKVVVRLRARGENYGEIGSRLGRSGAQIRRIEEYISFKSA